MTKRPLDHSIVNMGCGGGPNAKSIFTFNQHHWRKEIAGGSRLTYNDQRLVPTELAAEQTHVFRWKSTQVDWQRLRQLSQ